MTRISIIIWLLYYMDEYDLHTELYFYIKSHRKPVGQMKSCVCVFLTCVYPITSGRVPGRHAGGVDYRAGQVQSAPHRGPVAGVDDERPSQGAQLADCRAAQRQPVRRERSHRPVLQPLATVHWPAGSGQQVGQKHGEYPISGTVSSLLMSDVLFSTLLFS